MEYDRDEEGWFATDRAIEFFDNLIAKRIIGSTRQEIAELREELDNEKAFMQGVIDSLRWTIEKMEEKINDLSTQEND